MRYISLILLVVGLGFKSQAQELTEFSPNVTKQLARGFSLYLVIPTYMSASSSNINPFLMENQYPRLPKGNFNYGLGLSYRLNKIEIGIEPILGSQSRVRQDLGSELARNSLTANIFANYYFLKKKDIDFFGLLGYSGTENNLVLSKAITATDFNGILAAPGTSVNLQHYSDGFLLGVGMAIQRQEQEDSGTFRLKFAYRIPYDNGLPWESRFANFNQAPVDSFPYFFIQLELGFIHNYRKGTYK
jgi:hypothetical protein